MFLLIRVPPQSLSASSRDEGLVRGFHPYRPDEELHRAAAAAAAAAALPPPFGLDPAYTYHPAFLQPHPYSHPAFRFVVFLVTLVTLWYV